MLKILVTAVTLLTIWSCNNGPKVITSTSDSEMSKPNSGIFSDEETIVQTETKRSSGFTENLHAVVVNDILPTSKYVYLNVTEAGDQFWIAARKQEITRGGTYFYRSGLLKTNYECKECNKVFDTIYLVSNLVAEDHRSTSGGKKVDFSTTFSEVNLKEDIPTHTDKNIEFKGAVTIAEIVENPKLFEGKSVELSGTCVKVNPNIMNRNWIHLQDGSKDEFDFVITSNTFVNEGEKVTIRAIVSLNRDFGAGYKYDLILENGMVQK